MERWFEKSEKKFELVISPKKETESVKEWINDLKTNTLIVLRRSSIAYLVGAICDEKVWAEFAWTIPYYLFQRFKLFEPLNKPFSESKAYKIDQAFLEKLRDKKEVENAFEEWREIWEHMLQRSPLRGSKRGKKVKWRKYVRSITEYLMKASEKLIEEYQGNGDMIILQSLERRSPSKMPVINLGRLYLNLVRIPGIGPKKASMLVRDVKIAIAKGFYSPWISGFKERNKIDVLGVVGMELLPIDVHIQKFMKSILQAFIQKKKSINKELFLALAVAIDPENPGLVDLFIWNLRRRYCERKKCDECILSYKTRKLLENIYCHTMQ